MQNEFEFLKRKYQLLPLDKSLLKYSRMRPTNFPDLRLAQFAALLHTHPNFLQAPHEFRNPEMIDKVFDLSMSEYWKSHYRLGVKADRNTGRPGKASVDILLINTLVPFLFFYSNKQNRPEYKTQALQMLETCMFENNRKTRLFHNKSHLFHSALQSQACIQLYDTYCSKKRCLNCGIAAALLKSGR